MVLGGWDEEGGLSGTFKNAPLWLHRRFNIHHPSSLISFSSHANFVRFSRHRLCTSTRFLLTAVTHINAQLGTQLLAHSIIIFGVNLL